MMSDDTHRTRLGGPPEADPHRTRLGGPPSADQGRTLLGAAPTIHATQTIKPVQCPVCKEQNPPGTMFCVECGLIFDRALPEDAFGAPAVRLPVLVDPSGREHPLRPGVTVIGRQGDVVLEDNRVSRRHAQIEYDGERLTLQDLGSTNGTRVDGEAVPSGTAVPLRSGSRISLGGVELVVSIPGEAGGEATVAAGGRTAQLDAPPSARSGWYLVGADLKLPIKRGVNRFGRKSENDLVIPDSFVSGSHGVIELEGEELYLTDVGSTNGTYLGEVKLTPNVRTRLGPDDTIRIGRLEFRIERGD